MVWQKMPLSNQNCKDSLRYSIGKNNISIAVYDDIELTSATDLISEPESTRSTCAQYCFSMGE